MSIQNIPVYQDISEKEILQFKNLKFSDLVPAATTKEKHRKDEFSHFSSSKNSKKIQYTIKKLDK